MMDAKTLIQWIYDNPDEIGRQCGFKDLTSLHAEWMREIIFGDGDYTLFAHRSSYKSSCVSVSIGLIMVLYPVRNIIFLRKGDKDVSEMMGMVEKVLSCQIMKDIVKILYDRDLVIIGKSQNHIDTNLWTSPMGAPQLRGIGVKSSITGSHSYYVITDDINGPEDRKSAAERSHTKQVYYELQNICNRGGRIINLGTRWHSDDVCNLMPNQHIYTCYDTGLMTPEQIQKKREDLEPALFAANYELKIIASGDALLGKPHYYHGDSSDIFGGRSHVDAAYGGEDFTAMTILKRKKDGSGYIGFGKLWRGHVDNHLYKIKDIHTMYKAGSIAVERNGDKGYLSRDMRNIGLVVVDYHESENKYMKIATHLRKAWNTIEWLPETDQEYIDMCCDYNESSEHDDAPDSAASLLRSFEKTARIGSKSQFLYGRR